MSIMLNNKQVLLAKQETVQGTAVAASASTDAIEIIGEINLDPVPEEIARDIKSATLDQDSSIIAKYYKKVSFKAEIRGSGTGGSAAVAGFTGLDAILQACGITSTVAASQSVNAVNVTAPGSAYTTPPIVSFSGGGGGSGAAAVAIIDGGVVVAVVVTNPGSGYTSAPTVAFTGGGGTSAAATATVGGTILYAPTSNPASANFYGPGKSVSLEVFKAGHKHILKGCLGTFKLSSDSGKIGVLDFEFFGIHVSETDVSVPSITKAVPLPPLWQSSKIQVQDFGSAFLSKIEFDLAAKIVPRDDPRSSDSLIGFVLGAREPKGSIQMEAELFASFNAFARAKAATLGNTTATWGTTAGNIVSFNAPKTQIVSPKYATREIFQDYGLGVAFRKNTGDDSFSIVIS